MLVAGVAFVLGVALTDLLSNVPLSLTSKEGQPTIRISYGDRKSADRDEFEYHELRDRVLAEGEEEIQRTEHALIDLKRRSSFLTPKIDRDLAITQRKVESKLEKLESRQTLLREADDWTDERIRKLIRCELCFEN